SPASNGPEDNSPAIIPVSLSHFWNQTVTVEYEVIGGTATGEGIDYNLPAGTLTFDPFQLAKNISIAIINDPCEEGPETIELLLSQPNNAKLGDTTQHIFTIDDDEVPLTYTNPLGMKFVLIMPGAFEMGSDDGEWDEKPVHNVTINRYFYILLLHPGDGS
ncbi:MAG: Calx-beta domain-containing protein, partial [Planctomycetota bacterium]